MYLQKVLFVSKIPRYYIFHIEKSGPLGQVRAKQLLLGILYLKIGKRKEDRGNHR